MKVDSLNSLVKLGSDGLGIICAHKYALNGVENKLEKIEDIDDSFSIPMVFCVHKRVKDNPVVQEIKAELQNILR